MTDTCTKHGCEERAVAATTTRSIGLAYGETTVRWGVLTALPGEHNWEAWCHDHIGTYLHSLADSQVGKMRLARREQRDVKEAT